MLILIFSLLETFFCMVSNVYVYQYSPQTASRPQIFSIETPSMSFVMIGTGIDLSLDTNSNLDLIRQITIHDQWSVLCNPKNYSSPQLRPHTWPMSVLHGSTHEWHGVIVKVLYQQLAFRSSLTKGKLLILRNDWINNVCIKNPVIVF